MQPQGAQDTTHGWFSTATERGGHGSSAPASAYTPVSTRSSSGGRTWTPTGLRGAVRGSVLSMITHQPSSFQAEQVPHPQALGFTSQWAKLLQRGLLPALGIEFQRRLCRQLPQALVPSPITPSPTARVPSAHPVPQSQVAPYPQLSCCCFLPPSATRGSQKNTAGLQRMCYARL